MMKILVHFKDGSTEKSEHVTALDADNYVSSLKNVTFYEIVHEDVNQQQEKNNND